MKCICFLGLIMINIVENATVTISDTYGTLSYQINSAQDSSSWIFSPSISSTCILFIFQNLNIQSAQLQIYDSSSGASGNQLFTCASCGSQIPPPFYSGTNSVVISIRGLSVASFSASSFQLQYISKLSKFVNNTSFYTSFSLTLNMPYAKVDPLLVRGLLPANSKMMWMINVNNVNQIIFSISKFYFGNTCSSKLYIYNGWIESPSQLIYIGCQQSDIPTRWLYASSGQALILLKGGTYNQNISFIITYTSDSDMYNCGSLVQPDNMYDDSMIITDGSKSTNIMRRSASCSWLISPFNKGQVVLLMKWVSIKDGGSIVVYDGSTASSKAIIWNCIGPTTVVPPLLTSTTGTLYIVYSSNTYLSTGYFGFEGQYYTRSSLSNGIGSRKEILTMSSSLSLTPPWYSYTKSTSNRTISSLSSSSSFPYVYTWYILPSATVSFLTLSLFQTSLVSYNSTSLIDQLTIYNGPSLASPVIWQGSSPTTSHPINWLSLSSKQAVVQLSTLSRPFTGFQLAYTSDGTNYHCGFSTNPGTLSAPSMTFSDGSGASSNIIANQYCIWEIEVEGSRGVYIYFKEFDIRGATLSIFQGDSITGNQIVKFTDLVIIPTPLTLLTTSTITIVFSSGSGLNGKTLGTGFTAVYYTITKETSFPGDGYVYLGSSSVTSLTLPMKYKNISQYNTDGNLTWILSPTAYNGSIYISFSWIYFLNCHQHYLLITNKYFTRRYCGDNSNSISSWITVPYGLKTYIQYVTMSTRSNTTTTTTTNTKKILSGLIEGFELSYYADGPNIHCGFEGNTASITLTAPSMIFSDGSSSTSSMYPGQTCEWIISPYYNSINSKNSNDSSDGSDDDSNCHGNFVFVEFLLSDLQGASLEVYDGSNGLSDLLWNCSQCTTKPNLLIAITGQVFIRYISQNIPMNQLGNGFRLVYWSTSPSDTLLSHSSMVQNIINSICNITMNQLLELPNDYMLPSFVGDATPPASVHMNFSNDVNAFRNVSGFILIAKTVKSTLSYLPYISTTSLPSTSSSHNINDLNVRDGRPLTTTLFPSMSTQNRFVCGILESDSRSTLIDPTFSLQGSLSSLSYIYSSITQKLLMALNGSWNIPDIDSDDLKNISFSSAKTCVYFLKSSTPYRRIILNLNSYQGLSGGALRVYGGTNGVNALLLHKKLSSLHNLRVEIPCGLATVVLEPYNYSNIAATESSRVSPSFPVYSLHFSYYEDILDDGSACLAYVRSLSPEAVATSMLLTYIIAISVLLLSFLCLLFFMFYRQPLINKYKKWRRDLRYGAISPHPPYRPLFDGLRNLFLFPGQCCICQDSSVQVIHLKCKHALCKVDMKGYVEAALQDISKFPVKCPMHFEGCECTIPPAVAKRFINAPGYTRFLEFMDRSVLGEGMRCVFCNNFVNFPMDGKILMVDCPHCVRRFCMRCRQPWHYTTRCPFEAADDGELENWKQSSGAQKCPACAKLIEKDDPDTCNHMVHKITDSIPCVRNRTDFCYLCGLEVLADYPHEEVDCPGVNHFPDGVFQECRTVIKRLKEASRESDIKLARKNRKYKRTHANIVVPVFEVDENRSEVNTPLTGSGSGTSSIASVNRSELIPLPSTAAAATGAAWELARQSPPRDYQRPRRGGGGAIGFH